MNLQMIIAPLVLVLVEAIKKTELLDKRWLPLVALVVGTVAGGIFAAIEPGSAVTHVVNGLLYGGAAAGIYDAGASAIDK